MLILGLSSSSLLAQFQLPSMDVQLKSGVAFLDDMTDSYDNRYSYQAPLLSGEINFNLSQYFAAGVFYSKGLSGQIEFNGGPTGSSSYNAGHQTYGLKLRVSTGRQPRFRPFAELNYGKLEMYMEKDLYRISSSSTFFGFSLGLMIRLSDKLYLVLPQFTFRARSDQFFFEEPNNFLFGQYPGLVEFTGGLSYNFSKKK